MPIGLPGDISSESIANLPELLGLLETGFMEKWAIFQERQPMEDVKGFGLEIKDLGLKHNSTFLVNYGEGLMRYVDNFDVLNMQKSISEFPEILANIKAVQDNNNDR